MLTIALDYDNTYTADMDMWNAFIVVARLRGHRVIVATMREEQSEGKIVKVDLEDKVDDIIFTNRKAKRPFLKALGVYPDIWIDDMPEWITTDARS